MKASLFGTVLTILFVASAHDLLRRDNARENAGRHFNALDNQSIIKVDKPVAQALKDQSIRLVAAAEDQGYETQNFQENDTGSQLSIVRPVEENKEYERLLFFEGGQRVTCADFYILS
jgi:hypothetical protein